MNVKGKGQRLIPEELLKYLEAYKEAHPDPTAGGGATLDDIVDSEGNKRFIEGAIETDNTPGVTSTYAKWSLSGSHLMFVVALNGTTTSAIEVNTNIASVTLPEYITNKIVPIALNIVGETEFYNFGYGTKVKFRLLKTDNTLTFNLRNDIATSTAVSLRIQFDLLIDADYSE